MNILVFSWRDPKHPLAGGAEQVMHEHMKGWVMSGHLVTLFATSYPGSKPEEELDGVRIIRRSHRYLGVQVAGFIFYLKNKEKFDFIIDEFHGLPFFTPLYVRKPKLAVIQETARRVWFLNPLPWPINFFVGAIGYITEPFFFLLYRDVHFMTGSESARQDVSNFGKIPLENIIVVPHGVLVKKLKNRKTEKQKNKTVVYLGVLSKDKGIEDAVKCFSLLDKKDNFNFWVIGKPETGSYMNKLKKMVKRLGLERKIKFWGFVPQEKKFELLSCSHVLINPSVHEGWGLVNIEANAVGVPVVAYSSLGLVNSIKNGNSGVLCKENNPQSLAKNVMRILKEEKKYESLCRRAIAWSKRFSWGKSRALSLSLISRIANEA